MQLGFFFARFITGLLKNKQPFIGSEFSGGIEALGCEVKQFEVGDRVFGFLEDLFGTHAQHRTIKV